MVFWVSDFEFYRLWFTLLHVTVIRYPFLFSFTREIEKNELNISETDVNSLMDELGQELIATACVGLLERAFRCLGDDLSAFLTTLDGVNDVVQHQSGSENEAEFVCTANQEALELHFTTEHQSVAYLLVGSLKGIARKFYNDKADVDVHPDEFNSKIFR